MIIRIKRVLKAVFQVLFIDTKQRYAVTESVIEEMLKKRNGRQTSLHKKRRCKSPCK